MDEGQQTLLQHLQAIYISDLTFRDFFIPGAFLFWSMLLFISLRGIDCFHPVTAATYVVFCIAAGVLEVVALPSIFHDRFSAQLTIGLVFLFGGAATVRWLHLIHKQQPRVITKKRKGPSGG